MRGHVAPEVPDDEPPRRLYRVYPEPPLLADRPAISPGLARLLWLLSVGVVLGSMIGFLLAFLV